MDRKDRQIIGCLCCLLIWLSSCSKPDEPDVKPPVDAAKKVFIVCEGSLGNGNASLAMYLPGLDSAYENVFKSANGYPLGDVFQSMQRIGDRYFLCINNSDKIIVINRTDLKQAGSIAIPKPRYLLPVREDKAYVSSLFDNKIYVINPQTLSVTDTIVMPAQNPEGMVLWQDKAVICTWDTTCAEVYVLDVNSDTIYKEIPMGAYAAQEAFIDKEDKIWVLSGNVAKGKPAAFTRIDPQTWNVIAFNPFQAGADVMRPVLNNAKDTIYFIEVNYNGGTDHNGIYRMSVHDNPVPSQPFIPAQQFQYFWALGIEPETGHIFVGDPKGFIQKGSVTIYQPDGTVIRTFATGLGPGHFYFDY